ncbi:MAG: DUF4416 family protein [Deltaproteobacteria bacterium]|nr:DUF4416 family protein [Deltaproteobacteria bacterium]
MSEPKEADEVKLVSSLFSPEKALLEQVIRELEDLFGNALEQHYLVRGKRRVNIDPGYISMERLVLATGKNYTHRIYLAGGIYADLTLVFHKGSFKPLEWTYKDYATPEVIGFFNALRDRYKNQIRGIEE